MRDLLAGTFNRLVKAVALAEDEESGGHGEGERSGTGGSVEGDGEVHTCEAYQTGADACLYRGSIFHKTFSGLTRALGLKSYTQQQSFRYKC